MAAKPTSQEIHALYIFLGGCERAATPPPPPLQRAPNIGLLGLHGGIMQAAPTESLLGQAQYARSLADVMLDDSPPFTAAEELSGDRAARISQLNTWLERFPAFIWLNRQPEISGGLAKFHSVCRRRKQQPTFSDDLAIFRYWKLALSAVVLMDVKPMRQPSANQRRQAGMASQTLLDLIGETAILKAAGIDHKEGAAFISTIHKIISLASKPSGWRADRNDAYTSDRIYIANLAESADREFDDIPPSIICELAALKVNNPDLTQITKQISEYKKDSSPRRLALADPLRRKV